MLGRIGVGLGVIFLSLLNSSIFLKGGLDLVWVMAWSIRKVLNPRGLRDKVFKLKVYFY